MAEPIGALPLVLVAGQLWVLGVSLWASLGQLLPRCEIEEDEIKVAGGFGGLLQADSDLVSDLIDIPVLALQAHR